MLCVIARAHQMKGNIGFVSNHPTVVSGRDIENVSRLHFNYAAIVHRRSSASRDNHADVLDQAAFRSGCRSHVQRPFPSWLVRRSADRHAMDVNNLEPAFFEGSNLVGILKAFQDYFVHGKSPAKADYNLVDSHRKCKGEPRGLPEQRIPSSCAYQRWK